MRLRLIPAACGLLFLSLNVPAYAGNCYQVWDARENLIYQSIYPPFDLARPAFEREMANLRAQRRTFIFFDTSDCALTGSSLAGPENRSASADPASLLDLRSSLPSYGRSSGGTLSPMPGSIGTAPVNVQVGGGGVGGVGRSTGAGMGTTGSSIRY